MENLVTNLTKSAEAHPNRPAVRLDERTLSYAELELLAGRASGYLEELGIGAGDRVGLMLPNVAAFPVLYYAILRRGAIVVPMNPLLRGREIEHYAADSEMSVLFAHAAVLSEAAKLGSEFHVVAVTDESLLADLEQRREVPPAVTSSPLDTAVILYTSGTTGAPKGAELTHGNLDRNCRVSNELSAIGSDDVIMGCLPLFHAFGQSVGMNASVAAGALLTLVPRFDPETVLEVIERDGVTIFEGVPTMYSALAAVGPGEHSTRTLRLCVSGGASLPGEVMRRFRELFGADILEGYGLSETSPTATFNRADRAKVGSIGTPIPGVEVRLVNDDGKLVGPGQVGEIVVRGHNVMKGYWKQPDATAAAIRDGWFHTGDLARVDEDGFYFIVDRKKDLIIRSGYNIYPREIEEVLYEHPDVAEAAVIGFPHPVHGEEVAAAVDLRPGATVTTGELRDFVKERVAPYKYPREVWIVAALPKSATGKILKRAIEVPDTVVVPTA